MSWGMPQVMRFIANGLKRSGYKPLIVFRGDQGEAQWVSTAVTYIQDHHPRFLFTWQRLYGQARPIWRMANSYKVRQVVMDFGIWPHYHMAYFDPKGENAESSLVGEFDNIAKDPAQAEVMDKQAKLIKQIGDTLRTDALEAAPIASHYKLKLPGEKDFIFCPLQRCAKGKPDKVLELDAVPTRRDPARFAADVIREAEKQGRFVVLKQHMQGENISEDIPEHGPNHWLMPLIGGKPFNQPMFAWGLVNCSHVVAVNSTSWQLAMALDKPAAMCGRGWYTKNNVVRECKLIRDAIPTPEHDIERGKRFLALMLSRQLVFANCEKPHRLRPVLKLIHPNEAW